MKIVKTNLTGKLSFEDHVFNNAMETAAQHCEDLASELRAANGDGDSWVWPCADRFVAAAQDFRKEMK